jgi:hypothetical protein
MRITVNTAYLTSEQVKFLSQLGEFSGERTWEAHCDADEFEEAVDLLKRAGIEDVFVQFGN